MAGSEPRPGKRRGVLTRHRRSPIMYKNNVHTPIIATGVQLAIETTNFTGDFFKLGFVNECNSFVSLSKDFILRLTNNKIIYSIYKYKFKVYNVPRFSTNLNTWNCHFVVIEI